MSKRPSHLVIVGALVSICFSVQHEPLAAQDHDMVGERVRVGLLDGGRTEGVVVAWGAQDLSLRTTGDTLWALEWSGIRGVARLQTKRQTMRGLGLGAAIGAVGTGLVVAVAFEPCSGTGFCVGPESRVEGFMIGSLVGAALGGVAGMIIGTAVRSSSWEPVVFPGGASAASFSLGMRWRPGRGSPP